MYGILAVLLSSVSLAAAGQVSVSRVLYGPAPPGGGGVITNSSVLSMITTNIQNKQIFQVNSNTLGGDPAPNVLKTLTVYYTDGTSPLVKERQCPEAAQIRFDTDITSINYGAPGNQIAITSSNVYNYLMAYLISGQGFVVDSNTLGGDPAFFTQKNLTVNYYTASGANSKVLSGVDGQVVAFVPN